MKEELDSYETPDEIVGDIKEEFDSFETPDEVKRMIKEELDETESGEAGSDYFEADYPPSAGPIEDLTPSRVREEEKYSQLRTEEFKRRGRWSSLKSK